MRLRLVGVALVALLVVLGWLAWHQRGSRSPHGQRQDPAVGNLRETEPDGEDPQAASEVKAEGVTWRSSGARGVRLVAPHFEIDETRQKRVLVTDEQGEPIKGVTIWGRHVTDRTGETILPWPESSGRSRFVLEHDDFVGLRIVREREPGLVVFVLSRGEPLQGEIVFPDGRPVSGHPIRAEGEPFRRIQVTAGDDGRFTVRRMPHEPVFLTCEGARTVRRECPPGTSTARIVLERSVLVVRALDTEGDLVRQPRIDVRTESRDTGVNSGVARVLVSPGEDAEVTVTKDGYRRETRRIAAWGQQPALHEEIIRIERNENASVLLSVLTEEGGTPSSVRVVVQSPDGRTLAARGFRLRRNPEIRLDGLPAGPVRLRVSAAADPLLERVIDTEATATPRRRVEVRLPIGSALTLAWPRAPDGTKILILGLSVEVETYAKRISGLFRGASRLPAGEYEVVAILDGKELRRERFYASAGSSVVLKWE